MAERNVRVLLASGSSQVRDVLRQVVQRENGVEVVAQAKDVAGALTLAANLRPDVAVIDSSLPYYVALDTVPLSRINGLDAAQAICREMPATGVLVLNNLDLINSPDSGFPRNVTAYSIESDGTSFFIGSQDRWLAQRSVPLFAGVVARPQAALQQRDTVGGVSGASPGPPAQAPCSASGRRLTHSFESMRRELRTSYEERERWEKDLEARVLAHTEEVHLLLGRIICAQEEERKRLARELHDDTAQTLATLLVGISSMRKALLPQNGQLCEMLGRFQARGEQALRDIRRIIMDLHPSHLDDMGLVAALRSFAGDRLSAVGTRLKFDTQGEERRLSGVLETALFRIMQEAVTNITKHAQAENARILLKFGPTQFVGHVEDDGVGFDTEAKQGSDATGLGLEGMKERAGLLGARLEVTSAPGKGSRVTVIMPLSGGNIG